MNQILFAALILTTQAAYCKDAFILENGADAVSVKETGSVLPREARDLAQREQDHVEAELCAYRLKVTEEQGAHISEIITTMGESSVISLGFKRSHLKELGAKLKGLGSLHFLGYICTHENLKRHMKAIRASSFKWKGFLDGLKGGLDKEADSNKLYEDLPSFAVLVNKKHEELEPPAQKRDWPEFVTVLITD